jgi:Sec-independent protein translocase protein TatA
MLAFIQNIGPIPLAIIAVIALFIFGKNLPSIAQNFGKSMWSLKKGLAEGKKELKEIEDELVK